MRSLSVKAVILHLVSADLMLMILATAPVPPTWNTPQIRQFTFEFTDNSGCDEVTLLSATPVYKPSVTFTVVSEGPEAGFGTEQVDNTTAKLTCDQARIVDEPVFVKPSTDPMSDDYTITVPETAKRGDTVYWLSAADPDTAIALLTYSMDTSEATTKGLFEVTGNKLIVKSSVADNTFDYDKEGAARQYPISLSVSDGVYSSLLSTNITVQDVNDNTPVFEAIPEHDVYESTSAGSSVFQVTATDADGTPEYSQVKYSITGSTDFTIDDTTGVVSVASGVNLNYDVIPKYILTVTASDNVVGNPLSSDATVTINIVKDECNILTDNYGTWPVTKIGDTVVIDCQDLYEGNVSRVCASNGVWGATSSQCKLKENVFKELKQELDQLSSSTDDVSKDIENILKNLTEVTDSKADADVIANVIGLSQDIVGIVENTLSVTDNGTEYFFETISNIVMPENEEGWDKTDVQGSAVLDVIDRYVAVLQEIQCNGLSDGDVIEIEKDHLYTEVGRKTGIITFPDTKQIGSVINIPESTLVNKGISDICFGGSVYNSIGNILETQVETGGNVTEFINGQVVNSDVISIQLQPKTGVTYDNLNPPVRVTLALLNGYLTNPVCVFWDYNLTNLVGGKGAWSPAGCLLVNITNTTATCECTHLTNFAILMSPSSITGKHSKILGIISAVGCAVSMVCLILTIAAHCMVWRVVRSNRTITLMNLCVALLLALGVFLAGVNRTESQEACAGIAALIQYLFLAVFFLMLLIGIEILLSVIQVFGTKFPVTKLLPAAWCAPALIVAISMGVTKTKGYGNDRFCWLDIDSGLIWSFIGPVLFVILVNIIIVGVVYKKMASSTVMKSKSSKMKIKTSLRSMCVLLPVMGLTWLFGVLSVNSDLFILQYLFCICNTLQGLSIFLFHCVFNRQIREALKLRKERRKTLETFTSEFRNTKEEKTQSYEKDLKQPSSEGFENVYSSSKSRKE